MVSFRRLNPGTWSQIRKVAAASITPPVDQTPDAFSFTPATGVALSSEQTSNIITVAGLGSGVSVAASVSGGTYSKNGGAYVSSAGTATNGDTFAVRHTSSGSNSTVVTTTLTLGSVSAGFLSTTLAAVVDTTPDAFSFTDATGVALSSTQTSNTITVAGINAPAIVTITGGTYSKNGGGFVSSAGTAQLGDTFAVQHTASGSNSTATNTVLTIGGVSDTFTSTTLAATGLDPSISAPTLTLATANLTYPPQFDIALDDTAVVGDTIRLQWKLGSSDFTTPTGEATNTIDAGEATANAATFTGLSSISTGTHRFRSRVERGAAYGDWSNVVIQGPDDLAPALSAPTITSIASTTATVGCTTDEANGTLYYVLTTANTAPSAIQVEAGQNSAGTAAAAFGNQAITTTGAKTFAASSLTASTAYYLWLMHKDAVGNRSTVLTGGTFTTLAAAASVAKLAIGTGSTGAGADRSQYVNSTDGLTYTVPSGTGAPNLVKSPDAPPAKFKFEAALAISSGGISYLGVTDSARAVGPSVFNAPGDGGAGAGFTIKAKQGDSTIFIAVNGGASTSLDFPVALASGQKVSVEVDTATAVAIIKHINGATVTNVGSITMTSQIPTNYRAFAGGHNTDDGGTINFGATAWAASPTSGYTGW